jgi:hypothetical protein
MHLEEHHVERFTYLFGRTSARIGHAFGYVADKRTMQVVLEMRILHARDDAKRIPHAMLLDYLKKFVYLHIVRLRLELERSAQRLVFRHHDCLVKDLRLRLLCLFYFVARNLKLLLFFTHALA